MNQMQTKVVRHKYTQMQSEMTQLNSKLKQLLIQPLSDQVNILNPILNDLIAATDNDDQSAQVQLLTVFRHYKDEIILCLCDLEELSNIKMIDSVKSRVEIELEKAIKQIL